MYNPEDLPNFHKSFHQRDKDTQFVVRGHNLWFEFLGSNPNPDVVFSEEAPYYENYYLGDQIHWRTHVYPAGKMTLRNVYPSVDFVAYTKGEEIEYDWVLRQGAEASQLKIKIHGEDSVSLENGVCIVHTSVGDFTFNHPFSKYETSGKSIHSSYQLHGDTLMVQLGDYDKKLPVIIDPVLVFSTYSGSRGDNFGFTATYDSVGHLYAGGIVDTEEGEYPVTTGAFQTVFGGGGPAVAPVYLPCDVAISKYSPDGSSLLYATYLGGRSNEYPHSLGIDEKNNLLVFGTTLSSDFPVTKLTAADSTYNGASDIYVVKLSTDGASMLGGTFVGGSADDGIITSGVLRFNYADDFRGDIIADSAGNIFVSTCTVSNNFPVSAKAAQKTRKAGVEAVVFSLDKNIGRLRWSTFMGGSSDDAAYSIKLDDSGSLFVGGGTASADFPMAGQGYINTYQGGRSDGFVMKLTPDSGFFQVSTYWGTPQYDQIYFIDFDVQEQIYITGQTAGNISRTAGTYGKNQTSQFIARLDNGLGKLQFATTFGNRTNQPELSPCAFMVDRCYNIYFSGWGSDVGVGNAGTTRGLELSSGAFQITTDEQDFYLIVLGRDAKTLLYATYFGGDQSADHVDGGTSRFDKRGIIYQSVCSSCPDNPPGLNDFPTTSGSVFPVNVSFRCSNASFKFDFNITYAVEAKFDAIPRRVCTPRPIQFVQQSSFAKYFYWDFGDGDTSTLSNPKHVYKNPGKYRVRLVAVDTGSCNVADTTTLEVEVLSGPELSLKVDSDPCEASVTAELSGKDFANPTWDFGDGATATGTDKKVHFYIPGAYNIKVVATNPNTGCKDSIEKAVTISKDSTAQLFMANVFTPNADNLNECYKVIGLNNKCEEVVLKIFNRWGEKVFESDDVDYCWNGTVQNNGVTVPEGTYFYMLHIKSKQGKPDREVHGSINLIR